MIATRFPDLRLDEAGVRIERTHMVQAPTALPCRLTPPLKRRSARLWEITEPRIARAVAVDDVRFSPPGMEPHLIALQEASGRDLSTAIRVARNAPFFQSGPRHTRMRLLGFEALGSNRLIAWTPLIDAEIDRALQALEGRTDADLVTDFCEPLFRAVCQPIMGLRPRDPAVFNPLAPLLQEVLEPLRSLRAILKVQAMVDTLLGQFDEDPAGLVSDGPTSLLSHLAASGWEEMDAEDRKAFVLVLYGASFNVSHTLANAILALAAAPADQRGDPADPAWMTAHLDARIVPAAASPRFIYRIARAEGEIDGVAFQPGDTMQLQLADINRDLGAGHLAFGHGLHRCIGAALSRILIRKAVPALFARYPDLRFTGGQPRYVENSQTVILAELPCRLR
ncbi:MAG: cytochrome P450 [Brevundimonas sp.]|nr:MAG: cytochrome P450 [Brevundimonas sp.]